MNLTDEQIEFLHRNTKEMLKNAERQQSNISMSIRRTNLITMVMAIVGMFLVLLTLLMFAKFSNSINHSFKSMHAISKEVSALRQTMSLVDRSMQSMGKNIEFLSFMNESVLQMANSTSGISNNVQSLRLRTASMANDTSSLRLNTQYIDQRFGNINHSFGLLSNSVHDIGKPSRQFFPLP